MDSPETKRTELSDAASGMLPHIGREMNGCTVGMLCDTRE